MNRAGGGCSAGAEGRNGAGGCVSGAVVYVWIGGSGVRRSRCHGGVLCADEFAGLYGADGDECQSHVWFVACLRCMHKSEIPPKLGLIPLNPP